MLLHDLIQRLAGVLLLAGDAIRASEKGSRLRQGIEDETDRLFFTPWPDAVGAKGDWIARTLSEVNTALT